MQFIDLDGLVIHYADTPGSAETPLVFINSLGADLRIWSRFVDELDGAYRCIRYDKRGHGLSDSPPAPYAMDDHVGDLARLLDRLGIGQAVIVGASVGGPIAMGLAARRPELVKALVLCCTSAKIGTADLWNERIADIERNGIAAINRGLETGRYSQRFQTERAAAFRGLRNMIERTTLDGFVGTAAALRDADYTEAAKNLDVPTLLLAGGEDRLAPVDVVRATHALIPNSRFEVVDGVGHLPFLEEPRATASVIKDFLALIDV